MLKSSDTDGTLLKYIAPILNHEHELPYLINKNNSFFKSLEIVSQKSNAICKKINITDQ